MKTYTLKDVEGQNRKHPETFQIPSLWEREALAPGDLVKLVFLGTGEPPPGERMWVSVTGRLVEAGKVTYHGMLDNRPVVIEGLDMGDDIEFEPKHVASIESNRTRGWADVEHPKPRYRQ